MGNFLYGDLGSEHMIKSENHAADVLAPTLYSSAQRMLAGYYYVVERGIGLWYYVHKYNQRGGGYLSGTSTELNAQTVPSELISTLDFSTKDEFEAENCHGTMRLDSSYRLEREIAEQVIPRLFQSLTEGKTLYLVLSNEQCSEMEYIQRGLGVCCQLLSVFPAIYQRGLNYVSGTVPNRHDRLSYRVMILPRDYQDVYYHVNYETFHENVVDCGAAFPVSMSLTPLMRYYAGVCSGLPKNMEVECFLSAVHPKLERADRLKLEPFELAYELYESVQPTQFLDNPERFMDLWRTVCRRKIDFNLRRIQTLLPIEVKEYLKQKAEALDQKRKEAEKAEQQRKEAEEVERQRKEAEEVERQRKEAKEVERQRKEAEEAERLRKEAEEAERQRKVAEEAEKRVQEALKEAEEAERRRKVAEEAEQRLKEAKAVERQREKEIQKRVEEELQKRRRDEEVQRIVEEEVQKRVEEALQKLRREEDERQKRQREEEKKELELIFSEQRSEHDRQILTQQAPAAIPESALLAIKRKDVIEILVDLCAILQDENRKKMQNASTRGIRRSIDKRLYPLSDVYPDNKLQKLPKVTNSPIQKVQIIHDGGIWKKIAQMVSQEDQSQLYATLPMAVYYSTAYYLKLGVEKIYCDCSMLSQNENGEYELVILGKKLRGPGSASKKYQLEVEDVLRCYLLVLVKYYNYSNDSTSKKIKEVIEKYNSKGEFEQESVMRYFSDRIIGLNRLYFFWHFISLFCGWHLQVACWIGGYTGEWNFKLIDAYERQINNNKKNNGWYADTSRRVIGFVRRMTAFSTEFFSYEDAVQVLQDIGMPEDITYRLKHDE